MLIQSQIYVSKNVFFFIISFLLYRLLVCLQVDDLNTFSKVKCATFSVTWSRCCFAADAIISGKDVGASVAHDWSDHAGVGINPNVNTTHTNICVIFFFNKKKDYAKNTFMKTGWWVNHYDKILRPLTYIFKKKNSIFWFFKNNNFKTIKKTKY